MSAPHAEEDESRPPGLYDATETGEPSRLETLGLQSPPASSGTCSGMLNDKMDAMESSKTGGLAGDDGGRMSLRRRRIRRRRKDGKQLGSGGGGGRECGGENSIVVIFIIVVVVVLIPFGQT